MKYAIIILDGAAGEPLECWGGLTSLEQAHTPNIDLLAVGGRVGFARNVPAGFEPSSNIACTSILGYDPALYPIGRGAIEGASLGIELKPGQVALRLNLCTVSEDGIMASYSSGNISTADSHAIADELIALDDDTFHLVKGVSFRHILVVDGHPELMEATYSAPHNITDTSIEGHEPTGPGSEILNGYMERANAILAKSAVNARRVSEGLLPATNAWAFWPGIKPDGMESFKDVYELTAGMSSGVDLLNGLAKLTDMERYAFAGVTDGPDNDYAAQGEGALEILAACDVAFIHVEAPDGEGHDGNAEGKVAAIEAIDREIISRLLEYAKTTPLRVAALPDHPTPIALKTHTPNPVPFVLWGPGIDANGATRLTECEAADTGCVFDPGYTLLASLLAE